MKKCLVCENIVEPVIDFGEMPIANGFLKEDQFPLEKRYPLRVGYCPKCKMLQLTEHVDKEEMFNENYAYFASTSRRMCEHFERFSEWAIDNYLSENPFVVEIGSNDGIMLQNYAKKNIKHLGIEPSANVAKVAIEKGINTRVCFFDADTAKEIRNEYGRADIIAGTNVMCHLPYIHSVFDGVSTLLKENGVLIFEDPYAGDIVERTSYDQIYDEHAFYFSVTSVSYLAEMHGLEVVDAIHQDVHGGSMRYVLANKGRREISDNVGRIREKEQEIGLDKIDTYKQFAENVRKNKDDFLKLLKKLKEEGKQIVGYGATSKSTTVLNYCGIGPEYIEYISDTTPIKQGKFTPGMHIPVKNYDVFKNNYPEYAVLFAWNHGKEIMDNEKEFRKNGGKFILYVDEVRIE